jgi:hypothetical protein
MLSCYLQLSKYFNDFNKRTQPLKPIIYIFECKVYSVGTKSGKNNWNIKQTIILISVTMVYSLYSYDCYVKYISELFIAVDLSAPQIVSYSYNFNRNTAIQCGFYRRLYVEFEEMILGWRSELILHTVSLLNYFPGKTRPHSVIP